MKRIVVILLLAMGMAAFGQEKQVNLGLIPTPQQVEMNANGKVCVVKKAKVKYIPTIWGRGEQSPHFDGNWKQAYRLTIEPSKITINFEGGEGKQYALMTLEQLKIIYGDTIPCCTILDWPAYRWRGWMDDISRGPVPHEAYRQRQWQTLHALKYNFCNYYTEHTLYQKEFPDLAPAYADCKRHSDEVINLQLFAHAEKTLRVPFYQQLMDSKANFNPNKEETYEFLRKRIDEAFQQMPESPFFIIDCDETEQLGTGRAKRLVDSLGADQVYVDHINRCYKLVKESGKQNGRERCKTGSNPRVVMWGDIVAKNPAMMKQLPKDMTYIMWAYEPLDSYYHLIRPFKDNGTPFWVAPSLSHSSNMIPNPYRYMKNIANLAKDGYKNGAEGLMNTCWDDNGEALFDNCWHGLFWSAEMAWNPIKTDDPEEFARREKQFNENYARLFYGDTTIANVNTLYEVGALESTPLIGDWYTSAALMEPLLNFNPDNSGDAMHERIEYVSHLTDDIHLDSAANPHAHYALKRISATMGKCRLRLYISDTALFPEIPYTIPEYLQELFYLKREYLRLWDQENGEYERYIVCNRYDELAREALELDRHVFISVSSNSSLSSISRDSSPIVTLHTLYNNLPIYYTLDGSEPTQASTKYEGPFPLERSATIKTVCYNEYGEGVITEQYLLSHHGMGAKITLNTPFSTYKSIYSGGGENALIDGQLGSNNTYADGHWQGYWGDSIDAVIDFGEPKFLHEVSMRFMQNTFDWILAPTAIKVYTSNDGKTWKLERDAHFEMNPRETGMRLKHCVVDLKDHEMMEQNKYSAVQVWCPIARYLRVVVPNPGPLPSWHPAPGQPSYLFTDEIVVK